MEEKHFAMLPDFDALRSPLTQHILTALPVTSPVLIEKITFGIALVAQLEGLSFPIYMVLQAS